MAKNCQWMWRGLQPQDCEVLACQRKKDVWARSCAFWHCSKIVLIRSCSGLLQKHIVIWSECNICLSDLWNYCFVQNKLKTLEFLISTFKLIFQLIAWISAFQFRASILTVDGYVWFCSSPGWFWRIDLRTFQLIALGHILRFQFHDFGGPYFN